MKFKLIILIVCLFSINHQTFVNGDVESSLVFPIKKSFKENENFPSLSLKSESNQLTKNLIPTVINLPRDIDQTASEFQTSEKSSKNVPNIKMKSAKKKNKIGKGNSKNLPNIDAKSGQKNKKPIGRVMDNISEKPTGRVLDNNPIQPSDTAYDYDEDEDDEEQEIEWDDSEVAEKIASLQNPNSPENGPIIPPMPIVPQINKPNIEPVYNDNKQINSFSFVAGQSVAQNGNQQVPMAFQVQPQNGNQQLPMAFQVQPQQTQVPPSNQKKPVIVGFITEEPDVQLTQPNINSIQNPTAQSTSSNYGYSYLPHYSVSYYNQVPFKISGYSYFKPTYQIPKPSYDMLTNNVSTSYDVSDYNSSTSYVPETYNTSSNEYPSTNYSSESLNYAPETYNASVYDYPPVNYGQETYNVSTYNSSINYVPETYNTSYEYPSTNYSSESTSYVPEAYNASVYDYPSVNYGQEIYNVSTYNSSTSYVPETYNTPSYEYPSTNYTQESTTYVPSVNYGQETYNVSTYNSSTSYVPATYNSSSYEYPSTNYSQESTSYVPSVNYGQETYNESFYDYPSTNYSSESTSYAPETYNESAYDYSSVNYDQEPYNVSSYDYQSTNYSQESYDASNYNASTNYDQQAYVSGYNYTEKPVNNGETSYDYLEEAKKLSNKIGYQNTKPYASNSPDLHGSYVSGYQNNYNSNKNPHIYPSVYQLVNNKYIKIQQYQTVDNPSVISANNGLPYASNPPSVTTIGKVVNQSPKIIITTKPTSYPSADLFRRACTLKINGFPTYGICRTTCNVQEIGIKTKLKDTCSSYQLTCNDPFEFCCVPNQSEYGECNLDLFKPNEIISRIESSLNLPSNSLIKLSRLQPGLIDSIINYRPVYRPSYYGLMNYNNKFSEVYDVSRPSILHSKKLSTKPHKTRSSDGYANNLSFDLGQISTHFKAILNQPPRANPVEKETIRVLRRIADNPKPSIRKIYHVHDHN